jgi:hypothetical protein
MDMLQQIVNSSHTATVSKRGSGKRETNVKMYDTGSRFEVANLYVTLEADGYRSPHYEILNYVNIYLLFMRSLRDAH